MTSEAAVWGRLAAFLPSEDAQGVMDFWGIGEQEGGLDLFVSALLRHRVAIDETTRAEIAVVSESWGMWPVPLGPLLSQCLGNDSASVVHLIEDPARGTGATLRLRDHFLIPWIRCTACGEVLARAHTREPWGDLSYAPEHYVILDAGQGAVLHLLTEGSGWNALMTLQTSCKRQ